MHPELGPSSRKISLKVPKIEGIDNDVNQRRGKISQQSIQYVCRLMDLNTMVKVQLLTSDCIYVSPG